MSSDSFSVYVEADFPTNTTVATVDTNDTCTTTSIAAPSSMLIERYALTLLVTLMTVIGLPLYMMVWSVVVHWYKHLKAPFYMFVISAGVADISQLILLLFYHEISFWANVDMSSSTVEMWVGYAERIIMFSQSAHSFCVGINRLICIGASMYGSRTLPSIVSRKPTAVTLVAAWTCSIASSLVVVFSDCRFYFDRSSLNLELSCRLHSIVKFNEACSTGLPIAAMSCYIIAWTLVIVKRLQNKQQVTRVVQTEQRELRFCIQFSIITVALTAYAVAQPLIAYFGGFRDAGILVALGSVVNAAINPVVYLIFDRKINHYTRKFLRACRLKISGVRSNDSPVGVIGVNVS